MSLFVKEAQPPPGCGRHKWPDSHGPADNRRPRAGFFPRGAVPLRTSGGREMGSGTSSLSETPLLTARGFGRCCSSRPAGVRLASCRGCASRGWRAPGSTGAGWARRQRCREGLIPFASPRPGRGPERPGTGTRKEDLSRTTSLRSAPSRSPSHALPESVAPPHAAEPARRRQRGREAVGPLKARRYRPGERRLAGLGRAPRSRRTLPAFEAPARSGRSRAGRGGSAAGAGSPSALRRSEAGSPPAPFACRGRPAAPYNLIFPRARRSIAAHLIHSAVPRDGEGEKGGPGEPAAQVLGFPWAVPALQLAALAPRPERPEEGGLQTR